MGAKLSMEQIETDFFFSLVSLLQTKPDQYGDEDFSIYIGSNVEGEAVKKLVVRPFYTRRMEGGAMNGGDYPTVIMEIPEDVGKICYDFMKVLKIEFVSLHVGKPMKKEKEGDNIERRLSLVSTKQNCKADMYFSEMYHKKDLYLKDREEMKKGFLKSIDLAKKLQEEEEAAEKGEEMTEEERDIVLHGFMKHLLSVEIEKGVEREKEEKEKDGAFVITKEEREEVERMALTGEHCTHEKCELFRKQLKESLQ